MKLAYTETLIEAGCDEAGRGCLAGPVCAAAVILPRNFYHPKLNDSKQVKARDRALLRTIIESQAIAYSVQFVDEQEIDRINILNASFLAMHRAIEALDPIPELLLIDGNRFTPYFGISHHCIVKGDSKYSSIAAASILAKTYRDEYMCRISQDYPDYGWHQNKGYGTLGHRRALQELGPSSHHRKSFTVRKRLKISTDE